MKTLHVFQSSVPCEVNSPDEITNRVQHVQ